MTQESIRTSWAYKVGIWLEMIKFSHSVFALPFALLGAFLAGSQGRAGFFGWGRLLLIVICMVAARSVAMTFNRIADAKYDARNPRTADRALPQGMIRQGDAWVFLALAGAVFVGACYLFWRPVLGLFGYGNPWPLICAVPVLAFLCGYSLTKRFTWLSHFWLGAALMLSPIGAWVALRPPHGPLVGLEVIYLAGAVMLWTAGFDLIYACQDIAVDRQEGLFSLPARFGPEAARWISRLCHSLFITMLILAGRQAGLGFIYWIGVLLAAFLLIIEHLMINTGKPKLIGIAFAWINGIVSIIIAAGGILSVLVGN